MSQQTQACTIFNQLTAGMPPRLNFPADAALRTDFRLLAAHTLDEVERRTTLSDEQKEQLVLRLGNHCAKFGLQNARGNLERIIELAAQHPHKLAHTSLQGLLTGQEQHRQQQLAHLRRTNSRQTEASACPVTTLWTNPDGYALVELHTPAHLKAESAALKHCLGTRYNVAALVGKSLKSGDPQADEYMQYAIKMRKGESRIFSLREPKGQPVATLHYNTRSKEIVELEGSEVDIKHGDRHLPVLCQALAALERLVPIARVAGLPMLNEGCYYESNGTMALAATQPPADFVYGTHRVASTISQARLLELAQNPRVTLDISELADLGRLPAHIKANLYYKGKPPNQTFAAPHIETAADITIIDARAHLPALRSAANLKFARYLDLSLPALRYCRDLDAQCVNFEAPNLERARTLLLVNAGNKLRLPKLRRFETADIGTSASSLTQVDLPSLRHFHHLKIKAHTVCMPDLENANLLHLLGAQKASLPKLFTLHQMLAPQLIELEAPNLNWAGSLDLPTCLWVNAGRLEYLDEIRLASQGRLNPSGKLNAHNINIVTSETPRGPGPA